MSRVYNFSAGPAVLPEEVLREAAEEMMDYKGCGMSVMEMSHRSKVFDEIIKDAEADLRELMNIPDNYKVLFLQGGASQQFAAVPMNLMKNKKAGYIITGQWAKKAFAEAKLYGEAVELASSADKTFSYIPDCSDLAITDDMDYVYICENNTIYGTKFKELPNTKGVDLVADVSSCFLSEPIDVSKYAIIYGGVQKNVGPAGVVIAIIREDLITDDVLPGTPTMLKYKTQGLKLFLYGTLASPVTAKEIPYMRTFLKETHKDSQIIAVDAAVGNEGDIGLMKISDTPLFPGAGAQKKLGALGDLSIMGIVAEKSISNYNLFNTTRLNLVYKMAEILSDSLSALLWERAGSNKPLSLLRKNTI